MAAIESVFFFATSYGLLCFNERLERIGFQGRDEHLEAAMQEWFACVLRRMEKPENAAPRCPDCDAPLAGKCLGCGRFCC